MAAVVAVAGSSIVSLSIPPTYSSRTSIILEADDALYSPLAEQLSQMGVDIETDADFTSDPFVYDKILHSPSFLATMSKVQLTIPSTRQTVSLAQYITQTERKAWWQRFGSSTIEEQVARHIKCSTDLATGMITIEATAQHAPLAKQLADEATRQLQQLISSYRRQRALREVSLQQEQLCSATTRYKEAQQRLAAFRDSHYGTLTPAAQSQEEALEREAQRLFNEYNDLSLRTQRTRQMVSRQSAAFTPVEESIVPVSASSPHWIANLLVWLFYSLLLMSWYLLYKEKYGRKK